jgi:hypothetical protein
MTATTFPHTSVDARVAQEMKQTLHYTPIWLDLIMERYAHASIPLTSTNASGQATGFLPLRFDPEFGNGSSSCIAFIESMEHYRRLHSLQDLG